MFAFSPYVVKAIPIKCPQCGHEIVRIFKNAKYLGIPEKTCKKCKTEVYIENFIPWQLMSRKQKTGEIFSLLFRSIVLGIALGGLIGAVLLFVLISVFTNDLSEFPLPLYYSFTTLPPVLFLMIRPWFRFYKTYKLGKKYLIKNAVSANSASELKS